jgi:hypothetical protein
LVQIVDLALDRSYGADMSTAVALVSRRFLDLGHLFGALCRR